MAETPGKAFPALRNPARGALARIDPEGNITATGRTWFMLAGVVVWLTMTYVELHHAAEQVNTLTMEVRLHREALIKAGILVVRQ